MDINKINFIKKSFISFDGKTEKLLIYRESGENNFHFVFKCPKCGKENDFESELKTEKVKEAGKAKEKYVFKCSECGQVYSVERLKPPRVRSK
ncbi:MAG: phage terminase large subunit family protein [Candidatus Parvarchaeum sp.]|nr:CpXC domain-containing protein [Candidatus Parvarchaeota archaeon]MCW1294416.1 CpXC domain-containing protein [Candidatus Parvarchaeum tengchongense]MCW1295584.1 CpXC domain-containing protein [Candidatus Parvarchaeum tengchongense]MCW1298962.1 CpXC domain-containing protein [Candidatus Parvarchaeum tengchongense]